MELGPEMKKDLQIHISKLKCTATYYVVLAIRQELPKFTVGIRLLTLKKKKKKNFKRDNFFHFG